MKYKDQWVLVSLLGNFNQRGKKPSMKICKSTDFLNTQETIVLLILDNCLYTNTTIRTGGEKTSDF